MDRVTDNLVKFGAVLLNLLFSRGVRQLQFQSLGDKGLCVTRHFPSVSAGLREGVTSV